MDTFYYNTKLRAGAILIRALLGVHMKNRWFLSVFLLLMLLTQMILPCAATEGGESVTEAVQEIGSESTEPSLESEQEATSAEVKEGFEPPAPLIEYNFPSDYQARAKAAILLEVSTGTIIYGYRLDERLYPASLTKIMTCMLALEYGNPDDILTVSATALENLSEFGSTANLQEGEQLSLRELLYCIMVSSANEGCNVVAEYVSGSIEGFVALMNQKAQELGMTGTHFANTHGLHDDNHYTTVRDLAIMSYWAWNNRDFREYATTTAHTVPATNLSESRTLHTTNYLTSAQITAKYYYSKASGIKTGFTTPAGGCLASTATNGNLTYLSVVCGCETLIDENGEDLDMRFVETKRLMEYGFENYDYVQVLSDTQMLGQPAVTNAKGRANVVVHANANATVLLPKDRTAKDITMNLNYDSTQTLDAPLEAGQRVGTVTALYQGIPLATAELVTLTAVEREGVTPTVPNGTEAAAQPPEAAESGGNGYRILIIVLVILFVLICTLLILRAVNVHQAKKRAARRRRRAEQRRNGDG